MLESRPPSRRRAETPLGMGAPPMRTLVPSARGPVWLRRCAVTCLALAWLAVLLGASLAAASSTVSGVLTVTTLAGTAGVSGNADGSGGAARFFDPFGVACDAGGNVYVADSSNDTIRKVTPAGVVTTLAGTAGVSGNADGSGSAARFNGPTGVACDASGNVYVADSGNHTIRKGAVVPAPAITGFSPASGPVGTVVTVSGSNCSGASGVSFGGAAASYTINTETSITATVPAGATSGAIRVVTPGGTATSDSSFTVTTPARPVPVKLSPTAGKRGATVTITGSGFGVARGIGVVRFGKKACTKYLSWSATHIKVQVPAKAAFGKLKVTVRAWDGVSGARSFTVRR